jgi:hypothetical protein
MLGMVRASLLVAVLPALLAACDGTGASAGGADRAEVEELRAFTYQESTNGLDKLFQDMLDALEDGDEARARALARTLQLESPQRWFRDTFGGELGAKLYREYGPMRGRLGELTGLLGDLRSKGLTRVQVERFTRTGDEASVGYQSAAMERMVKPTALYSVRLSNVEGTEVFHLWSFAYQSGWFRWLGKTRKAAPESEQGDVDLLEYRLRHVEQAKQAKQAKPDKKPRKRKR